jgi:purine-nucleoside phosphorylase
METKEALHSKLMEAKGNTITDEELEALNLSDRQIALLLTKNAKIQELEKTDSFYDYEKEYVRIVKDIGRQAMEMGLGGAGKDRRKKKLF